MFTYAQLTFCVVFGNAIAIYIGFRKMERYMHHHRVRLDQLNDRVAVLLEAHGLDPVTGGKPDALDRFHLGDPR